MAKIKRWLQKKGYKFFHGIKQWLKKMKKLQVFFLEFGDGQRRKINKFFFCEI